MADEPEAPPQGDEDEEEQSQSYPFIEASASGGPGVAVVAGWADEDSGEPQSFVVNFQGSAGSPAAEKAYQTALEWYRDVVTALARQHQEE